MVGLERQLAKERAAGCALTGLFWGSVHSAVLEDATALCCMTCAKGSAAAPCIARLVLLAARPFPEPA